MRIGLECGTDDDEFQDSREEGTGHRGLLMFIEGDEAGCLLVHVDGVEKSAHYCPHPEIGTPRLLYVTSSVTP